MEEAERMADRIAIIDHGAIVAQGTLAELKENSGSDSLEGAFLKLTGSAIRDEEATQVERMRQMARIFGRR
jgi:ABC-2 type transport system ATP-binding protein